MPFFASTRRRLGSVGLRMLLLLPLAAMLAGCWDRVEINDLAIVTGVALDKGGPDSIRLTASIVVPANVQPPGSSGGGNQEPANTTKTAEGRTVAEAITRLQEKTSRRLFWSHNAVLFIGEDLARDGVFPVLDFFTRHRQPRLRALVTVVPGQAADLLAASAPIEKNVPLAVGEISGLRLSLFVTLLEFMEMLVMDGSEPVVGRTEAVPTGAKQPETLGSQGTGGGGSQGGGSGGDGGGSSGGGSGGGGSGAGNLSQGPLQPAVTGAAIFKGDRLLGFMDDVDARGLLWLRNELDTATVTVTLGEPGRWIAFQLVSSSTTLKPRFEGDRIVMEARIDAITDVMDNPAGVDTGEPKAISLLEEELNETIARRVEESFRRIQREFQSDVVGFGNVIYRTDPQRWTTLREHWDELFPTVELDVEVRGRIRETGLSARPLGRRLRELITADELQNMLQGK